MALELVDRGTAHRTQPWVGTDHQVVAGSVWTRPWRGRPVTVNPRFVQASNGIAYGVDAGHTGDEPGWERPEARWNPDEI